jgi:hypothetical protein
MMTLATLVIAGEADSKGNGSSGAFGNGSGSGACAWAAAAEAEAPPERRFDSVLSPTGGGGGGLIVAGGDAACFGLRGLSHFSQRIPRVIAAPHMKHFEAMKGALNW